MTDATASPQVPAPTAKRRVPWAFLSRFVLVASLIASNVATVVSDRVHQVAFDLFERVALLAGDAVADRLLSHSPTRLRRAEGERVARPLRAERDAIRVERDLALARRRALQLELDAAKATGAAAAVDRDAARAMAARRAAAVQKVARNATAKIATRSADTLATFPARAAPYVGVAALIGFTGYELKMDCELAQSLADLNIEHDNERIDVGPICRRVNQVSTFDQTLDTVKAKADVSQKAMYEALQARFPRWQKAPEPAQGSASANAAAKL
jgi:hypothetical protein